MINKDGASITKKVAVK
jgi:hypothetical protein